MTALETRRRAPAASPTALPPGVEVGPATVLSVEPRDQPPRVLLASGETRELSWALPYLYLAEPGDVLLVVTRGARCYATNVISGRGRAQVAFEGDALVRAEGGRLRLRGARVRLVAQRIALRAPVLERVARRIHAKVEEATTRVAGRLFERAGASRRVIDEDDWHSAEARTLLAANSVLFNGDLIRIS